MKYYTFYSESNNFEEILKDPLIKKAIRHKIIWGQHVMLGFPENKHNNNLFGYIVLKYGDLITNPINKDYTPIPNLDYLPKK